MEVELWFLWSVEYVEGCGLLYPRLWHGLCMIGRLLQSPPDVTGKQEMSTSAGKALKKMPATWVLSEPVLLRDPLATSLADL